MIRRVRLSCSTPSPLTLLLVLALIPGPAYPQPPPESLAEPDESDDDEEAGAGWYLVPRLRASPGAKLIDAIGAGPFVYVLDDQGVLHISRDHGRSFAARELAISHPGYTRANLGSAEIPRLFGGLRSAGSYNYLGGMGLYVILGAREQLRWNISDGFSFPYGTTGEPYLELSPDSPAFQGGIWVPGVLRPGSWNFDDPQSRVNGSFGRATRLLRETGRGAVRSHVVSLDVDDPSRMAVAGDGLILISRDGGLTFDPLRESPPFTCCESLVFAGSDIVGTTGRTLVVRSGGIGDPLLPGAVVPLVEWVVRDKGDPSHLLFVAEQELLESFDGGSTARRVFVARASRINHVAIDPSSGRVFVATMTSMFVRHAQDEDFVDTDLPGPFHSVEVNPIDQREVLATQFRALLRSQDGGKTFSQFMELDGSVVSMIDPNPDRSWVIVTERGVYTLSRSPPPQTDPARIALARYLLKRQPSSVQAMQAAYDRFVPRPPTRSWFDQWLPRVHIMVGALAGPQQSGLDYVPLSTLSGDTRAPDSLDRSATIGQDALLERERRPFEPFGVAMLSWDLPGVVGPPHAPARDREAAVRIREIEDIVARLHALRTRLLVERILRPPADHASILDLELRIEEMTVQLNALTGAGYTVPDFAKEIDDAVPPPSFDAALRRMGGARARKRALALDDGRGPDR